VESGAFFEGNCRHSDDPLGGNTAAGDDSRKLPLRAAAGTAAPAAMFAPLSPVAT
jgi:hypothetical protein